MQNIFFNELNDSLCDFLSGSTQRSRLRSVTRFVWFTQIEFFYSLQRKPYSFNYGVDDKKRGTNYYHKEENSGHVTKGSYKAWIDRFNIKFQVARP